MSKLRPQVRTIGNNKSPLNVINREQFIRTFSCGILTHPGSVKSVVHDGLSILVTKTLLYYGHVRINTLTVVLIGCILRAIQNLTIIINNSDTGGVNDSSLSSSWCREVYTELLISLEGNGVIGDLKAGADSGGSGRDWEGDGSSSWNKVCSSCRRDI